MKRRSPKVNYLSSLLHQATCYEDTCWSGSPRSHRPAGPPSPLSLSLSNPVVGAEPGSSQREGRGCLGRNRRLYRNTQVLTKDRRTVERPVANQHLQLWCFKL